LIVVLFATSVVGVVTGSTSLVTVPVLIMMGVDPRVAVATNMFGLTFMSVGGAIPFLDTGAIDRKRLPALSALTATGSAAGALLVFVVDPVALPAIISFAMIAVAVFALAGGGTRYGGADRPERRGMAYTVTVGLAVYGGFFSGGYVTLLTAAFVALLGHSLVRAVSTTKVLNVFSSLVATVVFVAHGAVDFRLGILVAAVMFAGGYAGARLASRRRLEQLRTLTVHGRVAGRLAPRQPDELDARLTG
jgi:uncharacterized membrane protein YfcA